MRAGDYVYLSGVIIAKPRDIEGPIGRDIFKARAEDVFKRMQHAAKTVGADLKGVVKINTFHVEDPALSLLDKTEQARVIADVKAAYVPEPHPAWTAVGTTGLFSPNGLVEIEVVIYSPVMGDAAD